MPDFNDYNKMSDTMMYLTPDTTLRLTVLLSRMGLNNAKRSFHNEVQSNNGFKLKREILSFYSIEKSGENYYCSVILRPQDMLTGLRSFKNVLTWFESGNCFIIKDGVLTINPVDPIKISGLAYDQYLLFEPILYKNEDDDKFGPGLRIYLGSSDMSIDISAAKYYEMVFLLDGDMFSRSQNMINYFGKPEFGTNVYVMGAYGDKDDPNKNKYTKPNESHVVAKKRSINQNRSFFDD